VFPDLTLKEAKEVYISGVLLNSVTGVKSKFLSANGEPCTVEALAIEHYATEAGGLWFGIHSENGIFKMMYTLFMWDVIFYDIPDVFQTAFQGNRNNNYMLRE
jgi:Fanconi-associated nuclease 1